MARRYCSRCLQTFAPKDDPRRCKRPTCRRSRPEVGWAEFLALGDTIDGRYVVEEILGAGGAGITYRCTDAWKSEVVAVKVLHGDRRHGVLANRLAIEGEVLELLDHPHIVPFRALSLVGDGEAYLVTRHMPGGSLDAILRRDGALPPKAAVALGRQLALALDYVHAGGIVHRDLKPANVLLQSDDPHELHVRLADFGIARVYRDARPLPDLTRTGAFIGTPEYAAPEQKRGEKGVGPAADAFALGALLHAAASGTPLHKREDLADWQEFRFRAWDPDARPRLTDLVDARGRDLAHLNLLDEVIDALMQPEAVERIDLGHAALRLGAHPDELAPRDLPALSPPSLVGGTDQGFLDDLDALLPEEWDAPQSVDELPVIKNDGPTLLLPVSPAAEREPRVELPPVIHITRDAASDWEDEEEWTHQRRRNRVHGLIAVAFALLCGTALAWPGGPGVLLDEAGLTDLSPALETAARKLTWEQPLPAPATPPRGRIQAEAPRNDAVLTSSMSPFPTRAAEPKKPTRRTKTQTARAPAKAPKPEAAPPKREAARRAKPTLPAPRPKPDKAALFDLLALADELEKAPPPATERSFGGAPGQVPDPRLDRSEQLLRERKAADERAQRYARDKEAQDARRQALYERMERVRDAEDRPRNAISATDDSDAPALDPLFRAPRVRPQPDDPDCE